MLKLNIDGLKEIEMALNKRLEDMTASIREELATIQNAIAIIESLNRERGGKENNQT